MRQVRLMPEDERSGRICSEVSLVGCERCFSTVSRLAAIPLYGEKRGVMHNDTHPVTTTERVSVVNMDSDKNRGSRSRSASWLQTGYRIGDGGVRFLPGHD